MKPRVGKQTAPGGVGVAIAAAVLLGASAPFAKLRLRQPQPGLLYLGSGQDLTLLYFFRRHSAKRSWRGPVSHRRSWQAIRSW
jgi:hypothetical protein